MAVESASQPHVRRCIGYGYFTKFILRDAISTSLTETGADHVNAADFPGKPSIALEISNIMPATSRSRFNKRNRDSPAREEESRDQHPPKRPSNDYARKPRHKTREDRYEYKAAASSSKHTSRNHKEKTKRPRRSRKQTTNDGFHASNVARERLTVSIGVMVSP